ncbi:MAG: hypothetical protein M3O09_01445 [Acidobacteriota bacterium]|nr:hypothetical protein [Acidobacteriota bacterium]
MPDGGVEPAGTYSQSESNAGKWTLLVLAILYVAGSLYLILGLRTHLESLNREQNATKAQIAQLTKQIETSEANDEALARQLGITKKELSARSRELQRGQRAAEERILAQQKQQIGQVSGEVATVKTDVGGVKSDVASAKSELDATRAKLESTIGDLGLQTGLIAKTRDDLDVLKHKGDRNYYEFTLVKGAKPKPISTVSLQIKKLDPKQGRYTLAVIADDKAILKKDRNVSEPIQFYTGRDRLLYELVIWSLDKKNASGYLSTPKGAPVPITASQ